MKMLICLLLSLCFVACSDSPTDVDLTGDQRMYIIKNPCNSALAYSVGGGGEEVENGTIGVGEERVIITSYAEIEIFYDRGWIVAGANRGERKTVTLDC